MSRTILLVTPTLVARGDFDARGALQAAAHAAPPAQVNDAASLTLAALALVKTAPRRVWVLTTSAVTAVLETAAGRLQGLSESELSSALAFEAEAMTGLPAMSSQSAGRRMAAESGTEAWWVTQISNRVRGEIEAEVVRRGARLEGIAHPGGLASRLSSAVESFELWHDLLFIQRQDATLDILSVDETSSLAAVMSRFPAKGGARMMLTAKPLMAVTDVEVLSLHDAETLRPWFVAWHEILSAATIAVPVLVPPAQPMSAVRRVWLSAATAAIALTLCAAHWWLTERQLQQAQTEVKTLTAQSKQREELQKTSTELNKVRTELDASRRLQAQALQGFGALLSAVAELRPAGLLVRALKEPANTTNSTRYTGMEATVFGLCTHEKLAAEFSRVLGTRLTPLGWSVRPARTTARLAGGTPVWDFEIPLRLDGSATNPQTASKP